MSNALALASVTAVLMDRLNDGLSNANLDAMGLISVTAQPPDRITDEDSDNTNRLNIYMWNASRNTGWANERLPARNTEGARLDSPYLALDMQFILTATGDMDLNAEILLGYGMQVLHEMPVLTREVIRTSLGGVTPPVDASLLPPALQAILASDLADQFEQIRITPAQADPDHPLKLEGLSNLWSAFSAPLRASALYHVSCVLIESRTPVRSALPVLTLGGRTSQLRSPTITRISRLAGGAGTARDLTGSIDPGAWIAIEGSALAADLMRIRLGDRILAVVPANASNARVDVQLPTDIRAGLTLLQIEHLFTPEGGGANRLWEMSNAWPLVVNPQLAGHVVNGAQASGRFSGTVAATMSHPVGADQVAALLFNPIAGSITDAFSVRCRSRATDGMNVIADLSDIPADNYLIRVEIGGAASALTMGAMGFDGPVADLAP
ncbi:hypothetical protein ROA7450_03105 [Roseovarius albus]|uniref:Pvc16 N-terminal domain-containing protein n=1 Tax=Roseovarius albus TaxID=1247867 RepID=A0A1X6ZS53_9RHOB|nr:DUF4255 domain-containing protein [Roseovarius albus]SLN59945.1 hypothetical protein ROA7450_03105 [Roseovarius albus]